MMEPLATYTLYDGSEYSVLERPAGRSDPLVMRFRFQPGAGTPPPHVHPHSDETFEVEEGDFDVMVEDEWRAVAAGESVTAPAGVRHTFRKESEGEVVIRNTHAPHHDFEAYIRTVAEITNELETTNASSPLVAARMAVLFQRHSDLIQPADRPLQIAVPVLAAVARVARLSVPD